MSPQHSTGSWTGPRPRRRPGCEVALDGFEGLDAASRTGENERALDCSEKHRRLLLGFRRWSSEPGVDVGHRGLRLGEQLVDVDPEFIVVGGVDDSRRYWAAQREIMLDEEASPGCDDGADRV